MDVDGSNQQEHIREIEPIPPFAGIFTPDGKWVIVLLASGWSRCLLRVATLYNLVSIRRLLG